MPGTTKELNLRQVKVLEEFARRVIPLLTDPIEGGKAVFCSFCSPARAVLEHEVWCIIPDTMHVLKLRRASLLPKRTLDDDWPAKLSRTPDPPSP